MARSKLKTIHLHIGLEKTGTTTIQEFLHHNAEALKERGVLVPDVLGHKNHKYLAAYGLNDASSDIAATSTGRGETPGKIAAFRESLRQHLATDIAKSGAGEAIISSEDLSRLFSMEEIERVVHLLRDVCDDLRIIVFMRRQDQLAASRYFSLVLGGSRETAVLPWSAEGRPRFYDYETNIGRWIDAVGADRISIVTVPASRRPDARRFDSVEQFCARVGLDPTDFERVPNQHVSLDPVNQIILQNFNVLRDDYNARATEALVARLLPMNDRTLQHIPGIAQARAFYAQFAAGNARLFTRLGVEDQLFDEDFSMYPDENRRLHYQGVAIRRLLELLGPIPDT